MKTQYLWCLLLVLLVLPDTLVFSHPTTKHTPKSKKKAAPPKDSAAKIKFHAELKTSNHEPSTEKKDAKPHPPVDPATHTQPQHNQHDAPAGETIQDFLEQVKEAMANAQSENTGANLEEGLASAIHAISNALESGQIEVDHIDEDVDVNVESELTLQQVQEAINSVKSTLVESLLDKFKLTAGGGSENDLNDVAAEEVEVPATDKYGGDGDLRDEDNPPECQMRQLLDKAEAAYNSGDHTIAKIHYEQVINAPQTDQDDAPCAHASRGSALAALGHYREYGVGGIPIDRSLAVQYYNESSQHGNETAQFRMGALYASGALGVEKNLAKMMLNLQFAAMGGSTNAQMALGYRYMMGIDVPKNCNKAAMFYEMAANTAIDYLEQNDYYFSFSDAHKIDSKRSRTGDDEEVVDYYRHAADKGDVGAQVALGQLYYYGARGVQRDFDMAIRYFTSAAAQGDAMAQTNLAHMLTRGAGVRQNFVAAFGNFSAAADSGHAAAYNGLGYLYLYGLGVPQDSVKAISYFNSAADQGHVEAYYNLGSLYVSGIAVHHRDYSKAMDYFTSAAQKGHALSMHKVGQMHLHGVGTRPSCDTGVMLFKAVAERGPWSALLNDMYTLFQQEEYDRALQGYLVASEQGFESAQNNAAYLLNFLDVPIHGGVAAGKDPEDEKTVSSSQDAEDQEETRHAKQDEQFDDGVAVQQELGVFESIIHVAETALEDLVGGMVRQHSHGLKDALRLYEYAADQGNVAARRQIGDYYYYGIPESDAVDYVQAAFHYRTASDSRDAQSMFNLGYMYEHGEGVPRDFNLAKRYYDLAAESNPDAKMPAKLALAKLWLHRFERVALYGESGKGLPQGVLVLASWISRFRDGYNRAFDPTAAGSADVVNHDDDQVGEFDDVVEAEASDEGLDIQDEMVADAHGGFSAHASTSGYSFQAGFSVILDSDTLVLLALSAALVVVLYVRWKRREMRRGAQG